ncbi:exported hypothetical protein [Enterobacterales bacterium 8AC]|nr:exported hypothetical protein [Enterobacterales bacterium 8AC]
MIKLLACIIFVFSFDCQASIDCIMDKPDCNTIKGLVLSQEIDESHHGVYINDVLVKSYETSNISDAFVYNDFGFKEDGKGRVEKLLITYNAKDCITDHTQVRCTKYVMIDLTGDKVFFQSHTIPRR